MSGSKQVELDPQTTGRFFQRLRVGHGLVATKKIMFGTNYSMLSHKRCLEGLAGLDLSDEAAEDFLSNNSARF